MQTDLRWKTAGGGGTAVADLAIPFPPLRRGAAPVPNVEGREAGGRQGVATRPGRTATEPDAALGPGARGFLDRLRRLREAGGWDDRVLLVIWAAAWLGAFAAWVAL